MNSQVWTIRDLAEQFGVSTQTIRRKVLNGELPEPDVGDIKGRGAKRWVADHVFAFLADRKGIKESLLNRAI